VSASITIRPLEPGDATACDAVVATLPYHFGDEHGLAECAHAVRHEAGLVAVDRARLTGFLTWRTGFPAVCEITWLAVAADARRAGVGTLLVAEFAHWARDAGFTHLVVTTLSEATPEPGVDDGYEGTRRFYRKNGFVPLWEPHGWWSEENQAVLMLRTLSV
jgi:GNAT superfamily N-acetyltransferase